MLLARLAVGPFEENVYLVGTPPRVAVVDPGAESERVFREIDRHGWKPERILLTHGHVDHIAHCAQVAERYGIGVWVHPADLPYLENVQWPEVEEMLGARPCPRPEGFFADGGTVDVAGLALRVLHTPGHTPGGVCLIDEASRSILVGDTIFAGSVGRTDLPGGDWKTLERSIRERLFALSGDWTLLPGHGPETTLEKERRSNPFVGATARFAP